MRGFVIVCETNHGMKFYEQGRNVLLDDVKTATFYLRLNDAAYDAKGLAFAVDILEIEAVYSVTRHCERVQNYKNREIRGLQGIAAA